MPPKVFIGLVTAALLTIANGPAGADGEPPVTPQALVYCTVCHGVQLMGNETLRAPRLSGMDRWYVRNQLYTFKKGWRGTHPDDLVGMQMQPMVTGLSDREIDDAAAFVSETVSPAPQQTIDGDPVAGRKLYASCTACHGADANGNEALGAPALTGHNDWYLAHQLQNYLDGLRGYDADDTRGQQMRASVAGLDDAADVHDVVSYIMTLNANSPGETR